MDALIYLHPADPLTPAPVLDGYNGLRRATWEWTFETGSHALRIVFGGVFDRFPRAQLALGHLGETLPFLLWRFDSRTGPDFYAVKLAKRPSQYVKDNIVVATSGMCSAEPLNCTINALGHDRVMFAADYPFELVEEAGHFIDGVSLKDSVRTAICFDTAARLLKLPRGNLQEEGRLNVRRFSLHPLLPDARSSANRSRACAEIRHRQQTGSEIRSAGEGTTPRACGTVMRRQIGRGGKHGRCGHSLVGR